MSFVHLHLHSEYSLLDSMVRVPDLIQAALDDGQPAVAVTDHGSLGGIYTLVNEVAKTNAKRAKQAQEAGEEPPAPLKPIVGMEAYLAIEKPGVEFAATAKAPRIQYRLGAAADADADEDGAVGSRFESAKYEHLTLIATSNEGWHNLLRLHNLSQERSRIYSKPRIDYGLLRKHRAGLIVLTGCLAGPVAGRLSRARELDKLDDAGRLDAARAELLARSKLLTRGAADALDDAGDLDELFEIASEYILEESSASKAGANAKRRETFQELREGIPLALDADRERAMADADMERLLDIFGPENVFVEMMHHDHPYEGVEHIKELVAFANRHGVEPVVTNDCHHTVPDKRAHDVWLANGSGKTLEDSTFKFDGDGYHLRTEQEMRDLFPNAPSWQRACDNTALIADRVDPYVLDPVHLRLPTFPLPEGYESAKQYLSELVIAGAERIYGEEDEDGDIVLAEEVVDRLREEMAVIDGMELWDYFLISWDMINFCRREGIAIGFGRGSAAGSITSYCLGIVGVDPLEYDLLFERFLEPGRAGMPDIDFDIEDARRHEVFAYMREKYKDEHVAHIGAWQNFQSKQAIKSVVKTLGIPRSVGEQLAALVPKKGAVPRDLTYALDPTHEDGRDFRAKVEDLGEQGEDIIHLALQFEEVTRGDSVHAAGLIIADESLPELVPLRLDRDDKAGNQTRVTPWDMDDVESYGLLKLDLLGLRNLGFLPLTQRNIEQTTGEKIDYHHLPHPDCLTNPDRRAETSEKELERVRAAYDLLTRGRTPGIFQMESAGMTKLVVGIEPENLPDLAAAVALYRPGPMGAGMHDLYVERKQGRKDVEYTKYTTDPDETAVVDSVLGTTYGCLLYQEQMMLLGTAVAGFDAAWRSKLRKAVGKKIESVMAEVGEKFLSQAVQEMELEDGTVKPAYSEEFAQALWDDFVHSASYAFNASHAYAYAKLAYATAYFKANWPVEYAAAVLARTPKGDKRQALLNSLASEGVTIEKPDINSGEIVTSPKNGSVWLGFGEIRDVSTVEAEEVLAEREMNGPFTSLGDFFRRTVVTTGPKRRRMMTARSVNALGEVGAFDQFTTRKAFSRIVRGQADHIGHVHLPADEWEGFERAQRERHRLGVVLSDDPIASEATRRAIAKHVRAGMEGVKVADQEIGKTPIPLPEARQQPDRHPVYTYGVLTAYGEKSYKRGTMAVMTLTFDGIHVEGVMWDTELTEQKKRGLCRVGMPVAVTARVQVDKREQDKEEADEDTVEEDEPRIQLNVQSIEEIDGAIGEDVAGEPPSLRVRPRLPGSVAVLRQPQTKTEPASAPRSQVPAQDEEASSEDEEPDSGEDEAPPVFDDTPLRFEDEEDEETPASEGAESARDDGAGSSAFAVPGFDSRKPPHLFCRVSGQAPPKQLRSIDGVKLKDVPGLGGRPKSVEQCRNPVAMRGFTRCHEAVFIVLLSHEILEEYEVGRSLIEAAVVAADWDSTAVVTKETHGINFEIAPIDEVKLVRALESAS